MGKRRAPIAFRGEQHQLFNVFAPAVQSDREPIAAAGDPETSHEAAAQILREDVDVDQADIVAAALRRAYRQRPRDYTAAELAHVSGLDRYMIGRRVSLCEKRGQMKRTAKRVCMASPNGSKAEGWLPVFVAAEAVPVSVSLPTTSPAVPRETEE